jgi:4-nitrophenyl phosphatase
LIATNDDATYPTPNGLIPGGGSILAAIVEASGVRPTIGGKPHEPMAQLVRQRLGVEDLSSAWMVGDRASTDGLFARQVGCKFAQVLTGVASSATSSDSDHLVVPDLASFASMLIDAQI